MVVGLIRPDQHSRTLDQTVETKPDFPCITDQRGQIRRHCPTLDSAAIFTEFETGDRSEVIPVPSSTGVAHGALFDKQLSSPPLRARRKHPRNQ